MEWWKILIIAYLGITYILGIFLCLLYLIGDLMAKRAGAKSNWRGIWGYMLFSPIFVPWWLAAFVRANKGG